MFSNLTKEIFIYSVIPAAILAVVILILLIVGKKKDNNFFKYNYFIKILLLIIIGLVLPLIIGYTIWRYESFTSKSTLGSNILYMVLLIVLIISLIVLLVVVCNKLLKSVRKDNQELIDAN